jgi:hypothetical protein
VSLARDAINVDLNMNKTEMIKHACCERIASSGIVYSRNSQQNGKPDKAYSLNQILLRLIEDELEFSFRTQNCLNTAGIRLIGQLVQKTEPDLLMLKNFGKRSLIEIKNVLAEISLSLETSLDFPPWNGDGDGTMLIQMLSMQRAGGGFDADKKLMQAIGLDIKKLHQTAAALNLGKGPDNQTLLCTAYLLDRLETEFEPSRPYLSDLIQRHKRWMQKELKKSPTHKQAHNGK